MVTAQEILNKNVPQIDANEPFHKVISLFQETDAAVITEHKHYKGMLLKRCLIDPKFSLQTKVHNAVTYPPKIAPSEPLEEIARVMVENNVYHLPVLDNEKLLGIVSADDVIQKLTEQQIGMQPVKTIMCTQPLSVSPHDTIGKALHLFQQEHITYLAVVEHNLVVGAVTIDTIVQNIIHGSPSTVEGRDDFESERRQKLDFPVKTIMNEQPLLVSPETTIRDVHTTMHRSEQPGILIGKENHLHGVVTHKELLAPYAGFEKEETIAIQFHHRNTSVQGFEKEQTVQFLREEFLKNYEKYLETGYLHVSLEQHKEIKQGLHRVVCEMKLSGKPGVFYATSEGYGPMQAIRNAFLAIEHQMNKTKKP
jgi:CBS domain-containing protein/ribosome-associated translation inhibitor RaiA